jgi:hypothetical protein
MSGFVSVYFWHSPTSGGTCIRCLSPILRAVPLKEQPLFQRKQHISRHLSAALILKDDASFGQTGVPPSFLQVNYYVDGNNTGFEQIVDLGYDCSDDFHEYRIDWTPIRIK